MTTATKWIAETDHGRYRVKTKSTVDRGQWLSLEKWAEGAKHWTLVFGAEQLRSVEELAKFIDPADLVEVTE